MDEIKVGNSVLDYMSEFFTIAELMQQACVSCTKAEKRINGDMYNGKALEDMKEFFNSLTSNTERLYILYQKGFQYMQNTVKEFHYSDEQLAQWAISKINAEGG